ncbi:MAG TPA: hypothetical protein VLN72_08705 [Gillisia sp.]|nr:hypothetical protein [Gillisia sp.]
MEKTGKKTNLLERTTFVMGLVILVFLFGYLLFQIKENKHLPPSLEVAISSPSRQAKNTYEIKIKNTGDETAQAANIEFEWYHEGQVSGSAVMVIDYVPAKSEETGWIELPQNKKPADSLIVKSITYFKP